MSLPSGYTRLEYIQSSGTQYIDTGISAKSTLKIQIKFKPTTSQNGCVVGYMQDASSGPNRLALFVYSNAWYLDFGNDTANRIFGGAVSAVTVYSIEIGNRYVKNLDTGSNIISGSSVSAFSYAGHIYIFGEAFTGVGAVYECQIYDGSTLIRDYIPCKNASGVIGLWDEANKAFAQNAGTGIFTAGPEVKGTHKTLIDATDRTVKSGKCLVSGTGYGIKKGRALVDGVGYDLALGGQHKVDVGEYYIRQNVPYAYANISNAPTTVYLDDGDEIILTVAVESSSFANQCKIVIDGETVLQGAGNYTYSVHSDCTIRFSGVGIIYAGVITVTTQ